MNPGNIRSINDNPNNNNNNNGPPDCKEYLKNAWQKVPLYVRIVIITSLFLFMLSFIFEEFIIALMNRPTKTIFNLYLWSIITTVFVNKSIINLLFAFQF